MTGDKATALVAVGASGSSLRPSACTPVESRLPKDHRDPTMAVREGCWEEAAQTGLFDDALYPRGPSGGRAISREVREPQKWELGINCLEQGSHVSAEGDEHLSTWAAGPTRWSDGSLSEVGGT